jgi:alpha-D-ribose 1-methylphosphonate 5-triphosphate synthase subunit PhnG
MTSETERGDEIAAHRRALGILARARCEELEEPLQRLFPNLGARDLKPVETGLVMLRGRVGGDGAPFNLGEATVSRAVVELPSGERGYGHVLGRDVFHARAVAILDALWRRAGERKTVETEVLTPIAKRLSATKRKADAETAATRVDFFTLVRGEDA